MVARVKAGFPDLEVREQKETDRYEYSRVDGGDGDYQ